MLYCLVTLRKEGLEGVVFERRLSVGLGLFRYPTGSFGSGRVILRNSDREGKDGTDGGVMIDVGSGRMKLSLTQYYFHLWV
jgi:hypothetical protein